MVKLQKRERPFSVNKSAYPFGDHWLTRYEVTMHYVDEGQGMPVIMLHGNPTWSYLYRNVIKKLNGSCRSIAPDYPGFGFSDHPPNYNYLPKDHAEWVNTLIDHLKLGQFVIVVQDWGGPIGFSIAVDRPDQVAGIVLCNTWCWPATMDAKIFSIIMGGAVGRYLHRNHNFFAKKMVPSGISNSAKKTPEVLKAYTDPFPTPDSRKGTYVFPKAIRTEGLWLKTIEDKLHLLKDKPVEMVWAMKDIAFGKEKIIRRWQSYFHNLKIDRIEEANHYLQEDNPERVAAGVKRVLKRI